MIIHIDISIFTNTSAIGRVFGDIEVITIPHVGDSIGFLSPVNKNVTPCLVSSFLGNLKVTEVILKPLPCEEINVLVMLQDLTLETHADAIEVMKFLEKGFSLFFDEYETVQISV